MSLTALNVSQLGRPQNLDDFLCRFPGNKPEMEPHRRAAGINLSAIFPALRNLSA